MTDPLLRASDRPQSLPTSLPLHPEHGIHEPAAAVPALVGGSVRRTMTIDSIRAAGLLGPVDQVCAGRDLVARADGSTAVVATAALRTEVDFTGGLVVRAISSEPHEPRVLDLIGLTVGAGFRAAVDRALPGESERGSLLHAMLDDLPGATLVSGMAIVSTRGSSERPLRQVQMVDRCAGWRTGGTIMRHVESGEGTPIPTGPAAPDLTDGSPETWHDLRRMEVNDTRRWRLLDVCRGDALGEIRATAFFRDSHVTESGVEVVVHEYSLRAVVDSQTGRVVSIAADAGVLPWHECLEAQSSARGVQDVTIGDIRATVQQQFKGPATCTHLNDTIRALDDVLVLAGHLDGHG